MMADKMLENKLREDKLRENKLRHIESHLFLNNDIPNCVIVKH